MAKDSRTLEIILKLRDLFSGDMRKSEKVVRDSARAMINGGFKALEGAVAAATKTMIAFGIAAGGAVIYRAAKGLHDVVQEGARLHDLSKAIKVSTEDISALGYAVEQMGGQSGDAETALSKLGRTLGGVKQGTNKDAAEAFDQLGISLERIQKQGTLDTFFDIVEQLGKVNDEAIRAELAFKILGRGVSADLLPVFAEGKDRMKAYIEEAKRLGLTMKEGPAAAFDDFEDTLRKFNRSFNSVIRDLAEKLLPTVTDELDKWANWIGTHRGEILDFFKDTGNAALEIATNLKEAARALGLFTTKEDKFKETLRQRVAARVEKEGVHSFGNEMGSLFGTGPKIGDMTEKIYQEERAKLMGEQAWSASDLEKWRTGMSGAMGGGAASRPSSAGGAWSDADLEKWKKGMAAAGGGSGLGEPKQSKGRAPLHKGSRYTEDVTAEEKDFFGNLNTGMEEAIAKWRDWKTAATDAGQEVVDSGLGGFADMWTSIILKQKSFKEAIKDWGKQMLETLAKVIPKLLIVRALGGAFGFTGAAAMAEGGIMRGTLQRSYPIKAYAQGGVASQPTIGVFGEAGAEAFVPLASGKIPVQVRGGIGGMTVLNFNIHAMDGKDVKRALLENRQTIMGVWKNGVETMRGMRSAIREVRAA